MIAKDCELTLITVNGQGNWCHLALALNGVMIPHQKICLSQQIAQDMTLFLLILFLLRHIL